MLCTEQEFDRRMIEKEEFRVCEERWSEHHTTRQLALDVLVGFRELENMYRNETGGEDPPFTIADLEEHFNLSQREIECGRVD